MKPDLTPEQRKKLARAIKASGTYSKAYEDMHFMSRKELRPVRLQLELLKPDIVLREHKIASTIVVFGSARVASPGEARKKVESCRKKLKARPKDPALRRELKIAEKRLEHSRYYEE